MYHFHAYIQFYPHAPMDYILKNKCATLVSSKGGILKRIGRGMSTFCPTSSQPSVDVCEMKEIQDYIHPFKNIKCQFFKIGNTSQTENVIDIRSTSSIRKV